MNGDAKLDVVLYNSSTGTEYTPTQTSLSILFPVSTPPEQSGQVALDWSHAPLHVLPGPAHGVVNAPFFLPVIPAGFSGALGLTLVSSQEAFADYLGMHRTFVGHLETGRKDFRLTTLIRVSSALGISLSDLFSGIEAGKPVGRGRRKPAAGQEVDRNRILKELVNLESGVTMLREIVLGKKK